MLISIIKRQTIYNYLYYFHVFMIISKFKSLYVKPFCFFTLLADSPKSETEVPIL